MSLGYLNSQLDEKHRKAALTNLAKWGAGYWETVEKAAKDALGLVKAPPAERLGYYYVKTIDEWEEQRAKYPDDFEEENRDFERLREREAKGEIVAARPPAPPAGVVQP
jgi:hypothetical protein